ncbi:hypothetical protein EV1_001931 [Malus domestica]
MGSLSSHKLSICNCKQEMSRFVPETGRMRSNMVRSSVFLKTDIRRIFGASLPQLLASKRSSRMTEINGVMPLPPLTITIMSCLHWHVIFTMSVKLAHTFGILNIGEMVYNVSTLACCLRRVPTVLRLRPLGGWRAQRMTIPDTITNTMLVGE